jgi:hypothetical protein
MVCHGVPIPHDSQGDNMASDVGEELATWNNVKRGGKDFLASFIMCRTEEMETSKHVVSIRITLKKEETAQQLCEDGAFLFGSHCHISVYIPWKAKIQENASGTYQINHLQCSRRIIGGDGQAICIILICGLDQHRDHSPLESIK